MSALDSVLKGYNAGQQHAQSNQLQQLRSSVSGAIDDGSFDYTRNKDYQKLLVRDPSMANSASTFSKLDNQRKGDYFQALQRVKGFMDNGDKPGAINFVKGRVANLEKFNADPRNMPADPSMSMKMLENLESQSDEEIMQGLNAGVDAGIQGGFLKESRSKLKGADQIGFESLLKDLPPKKKARAIEMKLGLTPKASSAGAKVFDVGGVPYIISADGSVQKVSINGDDITVNDVADNESIIQVAKTLAQGSGKLTSETISLGVKKLTSIRKNMLNLDRAIEALNNGAKTGAITKMLPSFRRSTVILDQIQGELGLDVVGATTFGALSKGELDLAKAVALPTGLDPQQLTKWLQGRKSAQGKLLDYFNEQIQYLSKGGTVPEFLDMKQNEANDLTPEEQEELRQLEAELGS